MPIAYHSDCCPLLSRELALLILEAYRLFYGDRKGSNLPETLQTDCGDLSLIAPLKAKVLPLSRTKLFGYIATRGKTA